jgi:hypothetical protein
MLPPIKIRVPPSSSDPSSDISTTTTTISAPTRYARSSDFTLSDSQIWCGPPRQKVGRPPKDKEKEKLKQKDRGLFTREPLVRDLAPLLGMAGETREMSERWTKGLK